MGCIFCVGGVDFDVDACLHKCKLSPYSVYHKGEANFKRIHKRSGFKVDVNAADFGDLPTQIAAAIAFPQTNADELRKLVRFIGIEYRTLDFPIEERDVAVQCDSFPAELLRLAGNFRNRHRDFALSALAGVAHLNSDGGSKCNTGLGTSNSS